jgi:hypothetical protein
VLVLDASCSAAASQSITNQAKGISETTLKTTKANKYCGTQSPTSHEEFHPRPLVGTSQKQNKKELSNPALTPILVATW